MATADCSATSFDMSGHQTHSRAKRRSGPLHIVKGQATGANGAKERALPGNRPLYGLPGLAEKPKAPVVIVEGEKTADAAVKVFPQSVVGRSNFQRCRVPRRHQGHRWKCSNLDRRGWLSRYAGSEVNCSRRGYEPSLFLSATKPMAQRAGPLIQPKICLCL
jgi:hypothetical protein